MDKVNQLNFCSEGKVKCTKKMGIAARGTPGSAGSKEPKYTIIIRTKPTMIMPQIPAISRILSINTNVQIFIILFK